MTRHGSLLFCLGSLLALAPTSLCGQTILVRVLNSESKAPIPTAFVSLMDDDGDPVLHALTNPQGRALFTLPGSGTYRLRAEMFGRETAWSPPIRVKPDSTASYVFELAVEAIPLAGIRVESEQQCKILPQHGREMARVWEEARKALSIQDWTDGAGLYLFRILAWERDLDRDGLTVESETLRELATTDRNPMKSLPVEELMRDGFMRRLEDGRTEYHGPDASILISNIFLNSHCFRLTENEDQTGAIGLAFEPVGEKMPDIEGTLWLDRETAHLRFLEFKYVNAPNRLTKGVAGGRADFERMPDGTWIVRRWWIQVPTTAYRSIFSPNALVGIHETGGVVLEIMLLSEIKGGVTVSVFTEPALVGGDETR